jgi:hypothetical protein
VDLGSPIKRLLGQFLKPDILGKVFLPLEAFIQTGGEDLNDRLKVMIS